MPPALAGIHWQLVEIQTGAGRPKGRCRFGVARAGEGNATVVGSLPGGAERDGDLGRIRIGAERYQIPDAVVLGG